MAERVETEFVLSLDQFQGEIDKAIKSMDTYGREAEGAGKANASLGAQVGSASQRLKEFVGFGGGAGKAVADLGKKTGDTGALFKLFGSELNKVFPLFGRITTAARTLGVAMTTALGPVGLVILGIVGAFAALVKIFTGTQEGADKLAKIMEPLKAIFATLFGLVQQFASAIVGAFTSPQEAAKKLWEVIKAQVVNRIDGLIKSFKALGAVIEGVLTLDADKIAQGAKDFGEAYLQTLTGVEDVLGKVSEGFGKLGDEIDAAAKRGARIADIDVALRKLALNRAENEGRINRELQDQLDIIQDVNKTDEERRKAGEKFKELQKQLTKFEEDRLDLEIEKAELAALNNDTLDQEFIKIAELKSAKEQAVADEAAANRRVNRQLNTLSKQSADKSIAEAKRVADERAKLEEKRIQAAGKAAEFIAKAELDAELRALSSTQRKVREVELGYEREIAAARAAFAELQKLTPEGQRAEVAAQEAAAIAAIEANLQDELARLRDTEADAARKRTEEASEELRQALTTREDLERESINARFARLAEIAEQTIEDEQALTDALVELERQRAEKLAAVRDEETERLREEQAERIAIIQGAGQQLAAISESFAAGQENASKQAAKAILDIALSVLERQALIATGAAKVLSLSTPDSIATFGVAGVARAAVIAALIKAALAAVRGSIAGKFHEGGLVGRDGGTKMHGGRDGWLARVERGEYVMPTSKTAKYMPYLEAMRDGTFERMVAYTARTSTPSPVWSDRGIVGAIGTATQEERRQTELLAAIARGMNRGVNKRYWA